MNPLDFTQQTKAYLLAVRFIEKRYTDADVLALYMKYREENIGSFVREVGDFIAHNDRDRGSTLEKTVYIFSQAAFFQRYQSKNKVRLNFLGECPWWLRPWFLFNIANEPMSKLKQISGLGKKELIKEVKSWFEGDRYYPVNLQCLNPKLFYALVARFSGRINGQEVFSAMTVRNEIKKMLKLEGIPHSEIEPIIVATAVLLQGKSIEIVKGFTASISLTVDPQRIVRDKATSTVEVFPDGNLKVQVSTQNNNGDGLIAVALNFLDTGIDTEKYFCRSHIKVGDHGISKLEFPTKLIFERNAEKMVFQA